LVKKSLFHSIAGSVTAPAGSLPPGVLRYQKKDIPANLDLTDFNATEPTSRQLLAEVPPDIKVPAISPPSVEVQKLSPRSRPKAKAPKRQVFVDAFPLVW
jgi:hypothetical protein